MRLLFRGLLPLLLLLALAPAPASAQQAEVQTTWRLLDYVAVDYSEAVQGGRILNPAEYVEMEEFSASIRERLGALPEHARKPALVVEADRLRRAIAGKAAPSEVAGIARRLAADLIAAFPVPLAPDSAPDLARAARLYAENCASCHGASGDGRGSLSRNMEPPPIAFVDRERAAQRSVFALYQVVDQGLEGTAMQSFANLPSEDRWALAFYAGQFAYPSALSADGERIWRSDAAVRALVPDLAALIALTPAALAARVGPERAVALTAFLRANPGAVGGSAGRPLDIGRERLRSSLAAYEAGDRDSAREHALAAYLDGFEPIEPLLSTRDGGLLVRVEAAMAELRSAIASRRPVDEVRSRIEAVEALFDETEAAIAPGEASFASSFVGGFIILAREGLEALLIVIAMIVFLQRADRREVLPYVHGGWVAALVAGVATWWAATHFITISGASREVTEGAGSLFAALVLLFVGIWMHGKAQADEWQRYIAEKLGKALSRRSAWFLFLLAFVAVYREVFETILFYAALSAQGNGGALFAGAAAAAVLLAIVAWAMLRYGRRMPIAQFFLWSSVLIALLAVVLAGKGVAAIQEAGMIGVTPVRAAPSVSVLGISPTAEALGAQAVVLAILVLGFLRNRRRAASEPAV
ncbi:MAG TPA: cytochrome c/FTR1 family iron permease [Allosphingosinicella sp.]|jgi:high-affinity iron transporter